jgi:PTH2 family peptidyl-tRNA hydrolase
LYAVVRADLGMTAGKMVSQAGHAFLGAFLQCRDQARLADYHKGFPQSPGTKVCLQARNLDQLLRTEQAALSAGLSIFRVVDSGCENFFGGQRVITALGIGPATKEEIQDITKKLKLL